MRRTRGNAGKLPTLQPFETDFVGTCPGVSQPWAAGYQPERLTQTTLNSGVKTEEVSSVDESRYEWPTEKHSKDEPLKATI